MIYYTYMHYFSFFRTCCKRAEINGVHKFSFVIILFLKIWIMHMFVIERSWKSLPDFGFYYTVKADGSITICQPVHQIPHVQNIFSSDWPKLTSKLPAVCLWVKLLWPWPKLLGQRYPFPSHYFFISPNRHYTCTCNIRVHFNAKTCVCAQTMDKKLYLHLRVWFSLHVFLTETYS